MGGSNDPTDHDDGAVRCRTLGHRWDDYSPSGMLRPLFGYRVSLRCSSCRTQRHELVNSRGQVLAREYRYADAYTIEGGEDRPSRDEWRVELVRRRVLDVRPAPAGTFLTRLDDAGWTAGRRELWGGDDAPRPDPPDLERPDPTPDPKETTA